MRTLTISFFFLFLVGLAARTHLDPAGFRVDLPDGWQTTTTAAGHVVFVSPNPLEYAFVQPQFDRRVDCAGLLQQTLKSPGSKFSGVEQLDIQPAGRGLAIARFLFQQRQARGAILCAETSPRSAMYYGLSAPAGQFESRRGTLMAILKSFAYAGKPAGNNGGALPALPTLVDWREPAEMAYTLKVPQDWRIEGGIRRLDVTHYNNGVQMTSPNRTAVIRLGDPRLTPCQVPGPGAMRAPQFCAYQSGAQFGNSYLRQALAQDFGLHITNSETFERSDIARAAQAIPLSLGLRVDVSSVEIRFEAQWNGAPVAGALLASTTLFHAVQGQNFLVGTLSSDVRLFFGPPAEFGVLARLTGAAHASTRINPNWWAQNNQISTEIARKTLAQMQDQAAQQQQSFWDRMAASDRRRESVNDVLGGTVRLSDGAGNQYQAQAGSNYYFLDTNAARTAGKRDDAVRGTGVWPSPLVDLTPLEVIR